MGSTLLESLNPEQLQAVTHQGGPLLILAGAGTGKTTVVTERIKWLIGEAKARPEEILALTFTEKAAREMEERVDQVLPYGTFGMWILTFHSFGDRILRAEALNIGLSPHYRLLTEVESYLLVKKNFWKFNLKYFRPNGNPYKFIEGMIQHFSRLRDEDVSPEDYLEYAKGLGARSKNQGDEEEIVKTLELANAYKNYEELKIAEGVMDFSDLIAHTLKLFRQRQGVLARYRKMFKYLLVDEFQDTNFAQNELVKLLTGVAGNVTVVADDDQSIYRFRGAAVSNVLQFRQDFPQAEVVTLTRNYRSTQEILDRSYDLIQHNNPDRLEVREKIDKKLVAAKTKASGDKIDAIICDRVEEEAERVVSKVQELVKSQKLDYKDFAILVRANNHAEPFVRSLERAGVPFQFLGPGMLFKQPEVRDLIAYLKVLADFTDSVSLYRVLSMDLWGLDQRDLIFVLNFGKKLNLSLFESLERIGEIGGIREETKEKLMKFTEMVHRHQSLISKETGGQILYYFLKDSGLLKKMVGYQTAAEEQAALNITRFFDKLKSFEAGNPDPGVFALVDFLNLAMDMGESPLAAETDWGANNAVNLLTVHSAKGLEFPVVFLTNLVEGRFPSRERAEQIPLPAAVIKEVLPEGDFHLEEERRLFYVGMTRAKDKLFLTAANFYGEGKRERKLSPFVREALGEQRARGAGTVVREKQLLLFEWEKKDGISIKSQGLREKEPVKIDYLSYSAIQSFRDCPLHFKLRHILKIPTPTTAPLSLGNSVHLALRDFYRGQKDLLECLDQNWISEGYTSKKHEQEALEKARLLLAGYLKSEIHAKAKPLYLEQPFTLRVDPTLKVGGKIDRIDEIAEGMVEIIDYKSGKMTKDTDEGLQLTIYALAATELFGRPVEKVKLSYYFLESGEKITSVRTKEQLENAKKELLAIRDKIQQSDFACSKSMFCENCEFKMLCG